MLAVAARDRRRAKAPPIAETAPESEALGVAGRIKQMGYRTGMGHMNDV